MKLLFDSFWRAVVYCLHPRVIALSLLPLVITGVTTLGLSYLFWADAVAAVRATLESWALVDAVLRWMSNVLGANFRTVVGPLIVVALAIPVVVSMTLVLVAVAVGPAAVEMVARRRFPGLERRHGGAWWKGLAWALGSSVLALLAVVGTLPLWFIPPLALVVPPLIWGWLSARVMGYDALAEHASVDERRQLMRDHRWPLLMAGVVTGFLCGLPSVLWTTGAVVLIYAPFVMVAAVWLYTLVFTFAALWFTHYALAALDQMRAGEEAQPAAAAASAADAAAAARAAGVGEIIDVEAHEAGPARPAIEAPGPGALPPPPAPV